MGQVTRADGAEANKANKTMSSFKVQPAPFIFPVPLLQKSLCFCEKMEEREGPVVATLLYVQCIMKAYGEAY